MINICIDTPSQRVVSYTDDVEIEVAKEMAYSVMPSGAKVMHCPPADIQCTSHGPRRRYCPQCNNCGLFAWGVTQ